MRAALKRGRCSPITRAANCLAAAELLPALPAAAATPFSNAS
jgi:hypothetical protein